MSEQKVNKRYIGKHACENCRKSKTRCLVDTLEQHGKCRKCLEHGTPCEWKEISQTRTRRRTDARVAVLEDQLRSLTAKLEDIASKSVTSHRSEVATPVSAWYTDGGSSKPLHPGHATHSANTTSPFDLPQTYMHTYEVDATVTVPQSHPQPNKTLPMYRFGENERAKLLSTFASKLHPLYPVTGLARGTLSYLEDHRPYTLNSMIVAACILDEPKTFKDLHDINVRTLAQLVVVSGEKSLDLVQALLITAAWTDSPDNMAHLNIFQWTHMAYSMAVELGLIGKSSQRGRKQDLVQMAQAASNGKTERLWTLLALCLSCSRCVSW